MVFGLVWAELIIGPNLQIWAIYIFWAFSIVVNFEAMDSFYKKYIDSKLVMNYYYDDYENVCIRRRNRN